MTYATLLDQESINSQYLAVIKPKRNIEISDFTLDSGTLYTATFSYGPIDDLFVDGIKKTAATTSELSDGEFYFDTDTNVLYIDISAALVSQFIIVTYEIYLATYDAHWYRIPTDNSTRVVYWEPIISKSPQIKVSVSDIFFGFMPTQSSQLIVSNAPHILEKHLYGSSFNDANIDIYHWLGDLETVNIKLIYTGICGDIDYSDSETAIKIYDKSKNFDTEFRNNRDVSNSDYFFYKTSVWTNLDPNFQGRPIRYFYGRVNGIIPVNIDYVESEPTTSDNRRWLVTNAYSATTTYTWTVTGTSSTTTRTYVTNLNRLVVGDTVAMTGSQSKYVRITNIDYDNDYFDHADISTPMTAGDTVTMYVVPSITIFKDNAIYYPLYGRDYTAYVDATTKTIGFDFSTSLETNLSMATNLEVYDLVYCTAYRPIAPTLDGNDMSQNDTNQTNNCGVVAVLVDILKNQLGLSDSDFDVSTWVSAKSSVLDQLSFGIGESSLDDMPSYRDLISTISMGSLLKIFINQSNVWTIRQTGPLGTVDKTIEDDEIIRGSASSSISYSDIISDVIVQYGGREVGPKQGVSETYYLNAYSSSNIARQLHGIDRQRTFKTYLYDPSDAQTLANRLSYYLGDRLCKTEIVTKYRFFDNELGDNIKISRSRLIGFDFNQDINRERENSILETNKSRDKITLILDDQKGIEDNSGSW